MAEELMWRFLKTMVVETTAEETTTDVKPKNTLEVEAEAEAEETLNEVPTNQEETEKKEVFREKELLKKQKAEEAEEANLLT